MSTHASSHPSEPKHHELTKEKHKMKEQYEAPSKDKEFSGESPKEVAPQHEPSGMEKGGLHISGVSEKDKDKDKDKDKECTEPSAFETMKSLSTPQLQQSLPQVLSAFGCCEGGECGCALSCTNGYVACERLLHHFVEDSATLPFQVPPPLFKLLRDAADISQCCANFCVRNSTSCATVCHACATIFQHCIDELKAAGAQKDEWANTFELEAIKCIKSCRDCHDDLERQRRREAKNQQGQMGKGKAKGEERKAAKEGAEQAESHTAKGHKEHSGKSK